MTALRAVVEREGDPRDPEGAAREAFMRRTIRKAEREGFSRIAVVCGAWHAPALADRPPVREDDAVLRGLPRVPPTKLFPVIKLECIAPPKARPWAVDRLWGGDPRRMTEWAAARGASVFADGKPRT